MMRKISSLVLGLLVCVAGWSQVLPTYDNIWIPMRDGELLQADIYIPDAVTEGEVILIQTPYNKNNFSFTGMPMGVGDDVDDQPFIWVIVDWRGFYGSFGADTEDFERGEDGYDICEWISEQDWHAERIGTWGPSALGSVQYLTARENHPNHTCAVPLVSHTEQSYDTYYYGGVLEEARLFQLDALGYGLSPIVLANPFDNLIWDFAGTASWFPDEIQIPTLQIGGWYDHNIDKMMRFYTDVRTSAPADVQDEQWLLVGPWVHGGTGEAYVGSNVQGELTYPNAEFKSDSMAWDFLNYYLLDVDNDWNETAMITYYELGNDQWRTSDANDIHAAEFDQLYLDDEGKLSAVMGSESSQFICDPSNPSPTIGGATLNEDLDQGPYDQSSLDSRTDILTFTSDVITTPVSITGRVKVQLFVESNQPDGDIAIRLVDVHPDGRNMLITDGIKRLRFRNNEYEEDDQVFMEPGEVYSVEVEMPFTNYTWLEGHAIKVYVSGNHSERFNVNLQDGGEMYGDGVGNIANMAIHHNATYPSRVDLPGDNLSLGMTTESAVKFEMYPNPAQEMIYVTGVNFKSYMIYDLLGNIVANGTLSNQNKISVSDLSDGLYVLRLQTSSGEQAEQKFIKK